MAGSKTNERPGTRASVKYVRGSASKARRVLDLIRNKSVVDASEILQFSETGVSQVIQKLLNSAIANAEHNDSIPGEELFVAACYADEGPTLKRFRPRARGRATKINKRTCHITVIVARYEGEDLEELREKQSNRAGSSAAQAEARRRRVAASQDDAAAEDANAGAAAAGAAGTAAVAGGTDLEEINGIGPKFAEQLVAAGVPDIAALANISDDKKAELAEDIQGDDIDGWVAQAKDHPNAADNSAFSAGAALAASMRGGAEVADSTEEVTDTEAAVDAAAEEE